MISDKYYDQVLQLKQIGKAFSFSLIHEQASKRDLEAQFQLMRALTETTKHRMNLRSNTMIETKKNRYPQQSIFQHSRIHLQNKQSDYINANTILFEKDKQKNILAQAPIESTVDDFTDMIIQQKIQCVIMLCNYIQNGKNRCYQYLENPRWKIITHEIMQGQYSNTQKSLVEVSTTNDQKYQFIHLYFKAWPDKNVPKDPQALYAIVKESLNYDNLLIHCSAGLGRSGVFSAIYSIIKNSYQNDLSVFQTVRNIRQSRFGAIQNSQQYKFIYQFLIKYWSDKLKQIA